MEMGQKIKKIREEKGMTLEELGDKVGVGKSTVRKWENGIISNMRRDKISKLANALDVSPAYLMGWDTTEKSNHEEISKADLMEQIEILLGSDILQAVKLFSLLDAMDRGAALERMRMMLENEKYSKQDRVGG